MLADMNARRALRWLMVLTLCWTSRPGPTQGVGLMVYVAPDGNDVIGNGSFTAPWATLEAASRAATPGTIIYLRGGIYQWPDEQNFQASGAATAPITITEYLDEEAILDGSLATLSNIEAILHIEASYVTVEGLEVRNSAGRGIALKGSNHVTIRGNYVHHIQQRAIGGGADNILIEANEVAFAALMNENGADPPGGEGWPGGISSFIKADGSLSQNWVVRDNDIHDIWGECLIALNLEGFLIEDNHLRDCWSVLLYFDKARQGLVRQNRVEVTNVAYHRDGRPAHGIVFAAEGNTSAVMIENIVLSDNTILNTAQGIRFSLERSNTRVTNSYQSLYINHNTVLSTTTYPFYFSTVPPDCRPPSNNFLYANRYQPGADGNTLFIGNPEAWMLIDNIATSLSSPPVPTLNHLLSPLTTLTATVPATTTQIYLPYVATSKGLCSSNF